MLKPDFCRSDPWTSLHQRYTLFRRVVGEVKYSYGFSHRPMPASAICRRIRRLFITGKSYGAHHETRDEQRTARPDHKEWQRW